MMIQDPFSVDKGDQPAAFSAERIYRAGYRFVIHTSSDHEIIGDRIERKQHRHYTRGLTQDYNRILKMVFKGAAKEAIRTDPMKTLYRITDKRKEKSETE